uniref:HEAT repeat-containing protein 1 n=1 Tax=Amphimedon queenslandica TaxID=400682 RepID=A0A1X7T4B7_AMPQE
MPIKKPGQFSQWERQGTSKTSFLFTGKDAGTLGLDSIYWLGLNGLEELISIDPSFNKYTDTLFSEASRDFERSILTQEAVKKVEESISRFLRLLSPYFIIFMLCPAHKCLEFTNATLMECVLPYYKTNLFAHVVQILRLDDHASFWSWLSPISRLSLVQHCLSKGPFLSFICNMVASSVSEEEGSSSNNPRHVLISFYASTVCEVVLESWRGVRVEYRCATYMVSGLLASKTQLSTKVINSLLESIINNSIPSLIEEAVQCMLLVASSSDTLRTLTKKDLLEQFCTSNKSGKKSAAMKYPFLTEVVQALTN